MSRSLSLGCALFATQLFFFFVDCEDGCCPGFEGGPTSERQCCRSTDCSICKNLNNVLTTPGPETIYLAPSPVHHCASQNLTSGAVSCSFPCSSMSNVHNFVFHQAVRSLFTEGRGNRPIESIKLQVSSSIAMTKSTCSACCIPYFGSSEVTTHLVS